MIGLGIFLIAIGAIGTVGGAFMTFAAFEAAVDSQKTFMLTFTIISALILALGLFLAAKGGKKEKAEEQARLAAKANYGVPTPGGQPNADVIPAQGAAGDTPYVTQSYGNTPQGSEIPNNSAVPNTAAAGMPKQKMKPGQVVAWVLLVIIIAAFIVLKFLPRLYTGENDLALQAAKDYLENIDSKLGSSDVNASGSHTERVYLKDPETHIIFIRR